MGLASPSREESGVGQYGTLYRTQGDLDRAEEMFRMSLELFREIGATPQIEQVEQSLADLRQDG